MPLGLKIALIVAAALITLAVLLLLALLSIRFKLKIVYRETLCVKLYVGGIRIATIPRPPKKAAQLAHLHQEKSHACRREICQTRRGLP